MDPLRVIAETQGVFLTRETRELGYDDRTIATAIRAGLWHRVRRGAYTFRDIWDAADPVARHGILARAVMRSYEGRVALSHVSAALEHGMATWGVDLSRVHVTRLDAGAGRTEPDVVHHEGRCLDGHLVERNGLLMTEPARAALETGGLTTAESALVTLDSALHRKLITPDELYGRYRQMEYWPLTQHLIVPVRMADGLAETPGESRGRYLCFAFGLPAPQLQFHVYDRWGALVGITDFAWPTHRLLGEFDGRIKYGRLLLPGQDPGDVVFAEKRREDLLREATRFAMIRLIWSDYYQAERTARRIRSMLDQAA